MVISHLIYNIIMILNVMEIAIYAIKVMYQIMSNIAQNVKMIIISDNKGRHPLRKAEYDDFQEE